MTPGAEQPPVPDPTILTTEQLLRETERVKEMLMSELNGMERESDERFKSVDQKFDLVEKQRVEQKTDTKDAVDAAFSAAKEAVREQTTASDRAIAKSETSMLEQLKQLKSTFDAAFEGVRRDIDELKAGVGKVQSERVGRQESTVEQRAAIQPFQVALLALIGSGVVGVIVALVTSSP